MKTPGGATVCALIVRPRVGDRRLPAILNFTIYADPFINFNEALRTASNGYAGIVGLTRGKGCSADRPMHYKYRPNAEHYLVIGPWDHVRGHSGTISILGTKTMTSIAGYELEPAAHLDMGELRYRWFDYVFGKGPKPAMLADRINYMVVGADTWKHAPSLAAMTGRLTNFHLTAAQTLSRSKPAKEGSVLFHVDLADRSDVDREVPGGGVIDKALDVANGLKFVSDPLTEPAEISGLFTGHLEFIANKRTSTSASSCTSSPAPTYVLLAPYWTRASYAGHPTERRLLTPGKRQRLDFESMRLMSRRLQPGSRLVAVLRVIKETGRQINYGTGKDVSAETIADAGEPLQIRAG